MNLRNPLTRTQPDGPLVTKAFLRAGDLLGLNQRDLSTIIGISEAGVSRLAAKNKFLSASGKESELALLFIRLFRSLSAIVGGRETDMRQWFHAPNRELGGVPYHLIKTLPGLFHVVEYLDAMRGKV